jgi:hypothetical protein
MELFLWMIGAHYIGDIALQHDWMAQMKGKRWYIMLAHCAIWTTCICVPLRLFGVLEFWMPVLLLGGHWFSDKLKSRIPKDDVNWNYIYYDQAFHGIQLFIVWWGTS